MPKRTPSTLTTHKNRCQARFRATQLITLLVAAVLGAAACVTDHRTAADDRAIAIYSTVIRGVAPPEGTTPTSLLSHPVFVASANPHSPISLEVQAGVVEVLHDFATIRFVDERSEAIDTADPDRPVHEGGVLITLGAIPPGRTTVTIEAQRYERIDVTTTYRIDFHRVDTSWTPVGPPVPS